MEIWKDIEGFEGYYQISNLGRVRTLPRTVRNRWGTSERGCIIKKFTKTHCGYWQVHLSKEGKMTTCRVHRLVAKAFIPNPESKEDVNHKDSDRLNNHVDNLEWATRKENLHHAMDKGRMYQYEIIRSGSPKHSELLKRTDLSPAMKNYIITLSKAREEKEAEKQRKRDARQAAKDEKKRLKSMRPKNDGTPPKPIAQYDLNGNLIKVWPSLLSVVRSKEQSLTAIWKCLKGHQKKTRKFIWKYAEKEKPSVETPSSNGAATN